MAYDQNVTIEECTSPDGPQPSIHYVDLPNTRLHYAKCGQGPVLIIVPATISRLHEWIALVQFMGETHTVYFFELPGHGESTPYEKPFESQLVAETVEAFMDELEIPYASIMGFSFGGLLTMRVVYHLKDRVNSVVMFAPAVTRDAIILPKSRILALTLLVKVFRVSKVRKFLVGQLNSKRGLREFNWLLHTFGNVDSSIKMENILPKLSDKTIEVLSYQLEEVLTLHMSDENEQLNIPCYFGMSINDTMLDYEITKRELENLFSDVKSQEFTFAYHQPPKRLRYEDLVNEYSGFNKAILEG